MLENWFFELNILTVFPRVYILNGLITPAANSCW